MPVMPGDDHPTEEPTADPGKEQAGAEPHADIVARLLDYQRRLREETGDKPGEAGERTWTPRRVEPDPSAVGETSDEGSRAGGAGRARARRSLCPTRRLRSRPMPEP